jgi:hypothetical protein
MLKTFALMIALGCMDVVEPPSDAEVLRALPRVKQSIPYIYEQCRDDITIVKTPVGHMTFPMRFCPATEPTQVTVTKWACEVYYAETTHIAFPASVSMTKKRVQVIYIEKARVAK